MRAAALTLAAAFAGVLAPVPANACGVCDEDKVAATYDHAVVRRAASQGRVMVFCEVRGPLDSRRLKTVAGRVKGLDATSLRTSAAPATLSFALDPTRQSAQAAVSALQALAPPGTQLTIVRMQGDATAPR